MKGSRLFLILSWGPALGLVLVLVAFPLVYSLYLSLSLWNLRIPPQFVGLMNYIDLARDSYFWSSLKVTAIYVIVALACEFWIGLGLAMFLTLSNLKGEKVFRTLLLLPVVISPIVVGLTWKFLYNAEYGLINYFLSLIHFPTPAWLGSSSLAIFSVIIADIWHWTPFMTLVFSAGIISFPREISELAALDGASGWTIFTRITLPLLRSLILIALLIRLIELIRLFDKLYVLTYGGPGRTTEIVTLYNYKMAFSYFRLGDAAALSWIILLFGVLVCSLLIRSLR